MQRYTALNASHNIINYEQYRYIILVIIVMHITLDSLSINHIMYTACHIRKEVMELTQFDQNN